MPRSQERNHQRRDRSDETHLAHGTDGCYNNHRCSCAACREAHRLYQLGYRDARPERDRATGRLAA